MVHWILPDMHLPKNQAVKVTSFQSSERHFPLMKSTTWATAWSRAAVTAARFCKNSSAVGLSPSTMSVTAFMNIAGTFKRSAT